ncbi:TBC1 domain family member 1-like [Oculina patagonica]
MEAELGEEREVGDDEKQRLRRRSKTTPPALNQFAMSNSLDSGVGSFEETDVPDKSCTTIDEQPSASEQQKYEAADSFRFIYLGNAVLDKRYTQHMLPWVIAEIRRKNDRNLIDLNVEAMMVKAIDCSTTSTLFQHKVQTITRCARSVDKKCFAYLTKIPEEVSSCYCYVFEAVEASSVTGFLHSIRDAAKQVAEQTENTAVSNKENVCDEPTNNSNNSSPNNVGETTGETQAVVFPLWYVGRVIVSHRQAPPTLIDDLVERFNKRKGMNELEKQLNGQKGGQKESPSASVNNKFENHTNQHQAAKKAKSLDGEKILGGTNNCEEDPAEVDKRETHLKVDNFSGRPRSASDGDKTKNIYSSSKTNNAMKSQHHIKTHSRNSSFGGVSSENRNILFKISIHSIACLSVVSKMQLMERRLREVSFCQQGTKTPEHFGFICHEPKTAQYYCYVFKGQSELLVDDVMQSLRRAFNNAWQATGPTSVCDMCPLHHLHQLCVQLEGHTVRNQYDMLQKHRINLTDEEMSEFTELFKAESPSGMSEENEVIMAILRGIYERRQQQHTHIGQGQQFQKDKVGPNLLQKAKKSLTSSFESFLSKRARARTMLMEEGSTMEPSGKPSPGLRRKRSVTLDSTPHSSNPTPPMSPLKETSAKGDDVFTSTPQKLSKQGSGMASGETSPSHKSPLGSMTTPPNTPTKTTSNYHRRLSRHNSYGYRQAIFHSVVTPSKSKETISDPEMGIPQSASWAEMVGRKKSSKELRALWRKAIMEQILLIRMEKENNSLKVNQNVIEANLLKLSYNEVGPPCSDAAAAAWNKILAKGDEPVDMQILIEAVKAGVPKAKRGQIWMFLAKQYDFHSPPQEEQTWREKSYDEIKEGSTCHQHSIFIDLGRTFPSHQYFSPQLGHGQLCLFNILKAYSVLDEEVGYCQGLSFVAGILLMHMKEEEAFDTLRFMMYTLHVRKQYRPDMQDLQTQFYMLSRLLHDYYKPVYEFLLELEITPTLYAAPWFLTLFASHFPVGFVARVLDMMFLQGMEVVFKVILILLGSCQEELLSGDGLEGAVEVMKTLLPPFAEQNVEWLVSEVLSLDISKDLESYEVEYCVLKEEDLSIASFEEIESERVDSLEADLTIKTKQIQNLSEQLSCARNTIQSLESTINTMQINQSELKGIIRSLRAENESLKKNFEKLKNQVLANGDVAAVEELAGDSTKDDDDITITNALTECSPIKPTCNEMNASSTEENTDSFEHIGSGNDLTDDEADSDEFTEGKPRSTSPSPPLSDKCEDLVVSR